ncbi:protease inhibitor I42 family protein [Streptomyces sp. DSM 42041]|uniref:Protease inhibitor I42 family protein n=1 Tax=Streptomyces hazeniae TaxID=3075538 RepID=A0ABU2NZC7_9ACTN|nr:protease inhibitor I42 family protein [Streptomyces sp. DSM 42041]MDT0381892.1 protease inhibitor I42 family protein [Streptomyces sp. DSM 42041]
MRFVRHRAAWALLPVAVLSGCGLGGPDEYELGESSVQAEVGEEFVLSAPVSLAMGENWYITSPDPDSGVVRSTGTDEERGDDSGPQGASEGTYHFRFEAVGKGTTKIRLIQCPYTACTGGGDMGGPVVPSPVPSGSPTPDAEDRAKIHTYTVTVK